MSEKSSEQATTTRRKRKTRATSPLPYFLIITAVVASGFLYLQYQNNTTRTTVRSEITRSSEPTPGSASPGHIDAQTYSQTEPKPEKSEDLVISSEKTENAQHENLAANTSVPSDPKFDNLKETARIDKIWAESQRAVIDLHLFYSHLDEQEYMKPTLLGTPSKVYFTRLVQKMLDNPPIVSGETDDLFNILQNTAHFFRIVGKENIFTLKAILFKEKDSFEEVLADYYTLTNDPDSLEKEFSLRVNQESLYDYAGFFLTTMGGRLYLFRRDSVSRMVVSYYSILIIEEANERGTNRHGIDIQPAVTMLINELENSSAQLKLKDSYLDTLYDLKEKYL